MFAQMAAAAASKHRAFDEHQAAQDGHRDDYALGQRRGGGELREEVLQAIFRH